MVDRRAAAQGNSTLDGAPAAPLLHAGTLASLANKMGGGFVAGGTQAGTIESATTIATPAPATSEGGYLTGSALSAAVSEGVQASSSAVADHGCPDSAGVLSYCMRVMKG